jgi:hypothetical protein
VNDTAALEHFSYPEPREYMRSTAAAALEDWQAYLDGKISRDRLQIHGLATAAGWLIEALDLLEARGA